MSDSPSPLPSLLLSEHHLEEEEEEEEEEYDQNDDDQGLVSPVTTDDESMAPTGTVQTGVMEGLLELPRVTWMTDRRPPLKGTEAIVDEIDRHDPQSNGHVETSDDNRLSRLISHKSKMDDDSLGLGSASSPHQEPHCHQREPEGAVSRHAIRESRRFSDDFQKEVMGEGQVVVDCGEERNGGGCTVTTNSDASHSSPPTALKEISISRHLHDEDDGFEAEDEHDIMEESLKIPLPISVLAVRAQGPETSPKSEDDENGHHDSDHSLLNASLDAPSLPREPAFRPPHTAELVPPESDMSVFSVHSGYGLHDQSGLLPRIVHGTMVQTTGVHHPYPGHVHHVQQGISAQLSMGSSNGYPPQHYHSHYGGTPIPPPAVMIPPSSGKRKVHFRLVEDILLPTRKKTSFLSFRRPSHRSLLTASPVAEEPPTEVDRGRVTVSWYEGTTALELTEHVRTAVIRKLDLRGTTKLADLRILDETTNPPEEIVLSPYIPNGSRLLLRLTTRNANGYDTPPYGKPTTYSAPDSPSAAPSPHLSQVDLEGLGLSASQLALLGARLKSLQMPSANGLDSGSTPNRRSRKSGSTTSKRASKQSQPRKLDATSNERAESPESDKDDGKDDQSSVFEMQSLHPDDQIQKSLENITQLLTMERERIRHFPKQEKRQVIFIIANYFVLFISLIAISAEIQSRAPEWNAAIERHLNSVKNCSKDQDTLFECVSNGDFSGLVASVVLFLSRSAATKRIFLFGFDSPRKLWTVVYESLVTAVCWGFSYMFIRRGMNPDTNRNFLQKYWKDAMYGSLAGFNAAFMKMVLKNLVPQEAIEVALHERQLKFLSWLPSFA